MSTSPLSPEDIRAAAETHRELGPEYSDAVVASFLDKVDREVAARVDARLAGLAPAEPAKPESRRTLLKGIAIGACAGALVAAVAVGPARGPAPVHRPLMPAQVVRPPRIVPPYVHPPPVPAPPVPAPPSG